MYTHWEPPTEPLSGKSWCTSQSAVVSPHTHNTEGEKKETGAREQKYCTNLRYLSLFFSCLLHYIYLTALVTLQIKRSRAVCENLTFFSAHMCAHVVAAVFCLLWGKLSTGFSEWMCLKGAKVLNATGHDCLALTYLRWAERLFHRTVKNKSSQKETETPCVYVLLDAKNRICWANFNFSYVCHFLGDLWKSVYCCDSFTTPVVTIRRHHHTSLTWLSRSGRSVWQHVRMLRQKSQVAPLVDTAVWTCREFVLHRDCLWLGFSGGCAESWWILYWILCQRHQRWGLCCAYRYMNMIHNPPNS